MNSVTKITSCNKCKYFIKCIDPNFVQYSKCALFGYKAQSDTFYTYEFANICRKSVNLCGGKYFTFNRKI